MNACITSTCRFGAMLALSMLGSTLLVTPAQAAGSIKAAYVETVIPSRTFSRATNLTGMTGLLLGPDSGILGVTSLTLSNLNNTLQNVLISSPVLVGTPTSCAGASYLSIGNPAFQVWIQPNSTLHLTFPSPLVFNPSNGLSCLGVSVTSTQNPGGFVQVFVNGVVN